MEVKGTAVRTIPEFIKARHPEAYQTWFDNLPDKSKAIFSGLIPAPNWYPVDDAIIVPTSMMSRQLYGGDRDGAWQCGRYSAEMALNGIYKLYVKMSSPGHIIERAGRIVQAYYQPSGIQVVERKPKSVVLHLTKFPKPHKVIDYRFCGWMEKALEISGCHNISTNITRSLTEGDFLTEFKISWD